MRLIGMLDSPYVRRVAISLQLLGIRFEHQSLSVFRNLEEFRRINPVVKAPTLVLDEGQVLIDSTLILDYAECLPGNRRRLMPAEPAARLAALQSIAFALAACEKSVQIIYERAIRPPEKRHQPWVDRVTAQLLAACSELESRLVLHPPAADSETIDQAGVTAAVTWQFLQQMIPEIVVATGFPALNNFTARAEALPEFSAAPHGSDTYHPHS
jgi:glutathione S-transferase